ncbi:MAG TPA: hypothetical protein PK074_09070 [Spirochaetales bacterium]|nr:hypothetical protein [Spirochaetales bacterium]HQK34863.1 hypothetical protein [Spirochaetales bacterium]
MPNKLFNTTFENALRLLILLDVYDYPQTMDMLYAVDFMATYGRTFNITEDNLNGDNQYKFSEFASRREAVKIALKALVLDGLVQALNLNDGITYTVSSDGEDYCNSLESEYATEYRRNAQLVIKSVAGKTERELISKINKMSARSFMKEET